MSSFKTPEDIIDLSKYPLTHKLLGDLILEQPYTPECIVKVARLAADQATWNSLIHDFSCDPGIKEVQETFSAGEGLSEEDELIAEKLSGNPWVWVKRMDTSRPLGHLRQQKVFDVRGKLFSITSGTKANSNERARRAWAIAFSRALREAGYAAAVPYNERLVYMHQGATAGDTLKVLRPEAREYVLNSVSDESGGEHVKQDCPFHMCGAALSRKNASKLWNMLTWWRKIHEELRIVEHQSIGALDLLTPEPYAAFAYLGPEDVRRMARYVPERDGHWNLTFFTLQDVMEQIQMQFEASKLGVQLRLATAVRQHLGRRAPPVAYSTFGITLKSGERRFSPCILQGVANMNACDWWPQISTEECKEWVDYQASLEECKTVIRPSYKEVQSFVVRDDIYNDCNVEESKNVPKWYIVLRRIMAWSCMWYDSRQTVMADGMEDAVKDVLGKALLEWKREELVSKTMDWWALYLAEHLPEKLLKQDYRRTFVVKGDYAPEGAHANSWTWPVWFMKFVLRRPYLFLISYLRLHTGENCTLWEGMFETEADFKGPGFESYASLEAEDAEAAEIVLVNANKEEFWSKPSVPDVLKSTVEMYRTPQAEYWMKRIWHFDEAEELMKELIRAGAGPEPELKERGSQNECEAIAAAHFPFTRRFYGSVPKPLAGPTLREEDVQPSILAKRKASQLSKLPSVTFGEDGMVVMPPQPQRPKLN